MVIVLKEKHEELWDAIMEIYKVQLPAEKFEHAKGRMEGFRKAYGTVSSHQTRKRKKEKKKQEKKKEEKNKDFSYH